MSAAIHSFGTEDIETFKRDGVLIVRNFVGEPWLGKLQERASSQFREDEPALNVTMFMEAYPEFRDFIFQSGVSQSAAELVGSESVRLLASELFCKPPVAPGADNTLDWHADLTYTPIRSPAPTGGMFSAWIALGKVTREMGAVRFIKGSHWWPEIVRQRTGEPQPEGIDCPDFTWIEDHCPGTINGMVIAELEPGDAVFFTARTAHSSSPNHSKQWRIGYSIRWLDDSALYAPGPGTLQPPEEWEKQKVAGLVHGQKIDRFFPLIWARSEDAYQREKQVSEFDRVPELEFHGAGRNSDILINTDPKYKQTA